MGAKAKIVFNEKSLKAIPFAKDGTSKNYYDRDARGLMLRVTSRSKTFYFNRTVDHVETKIRLGVWDEISIKEARGKVGEFVGKVFRNEELVSPKETAEEDAALAEQKRLLGVEVVAQRWLDEHVDTLRRGWPNAGRFMKNDIVPPLKDKLITEVTRADVKEILATIKGRAPVSANRALSVINSWLNWCVDAHGISLPANPASGIKKPTAESSRDRVLTDIELLEILAVLKLMEYPFGPFVHLLMLCGQRKGEVATMEWNDVDLGNAVWKLPAAKTKTDSASAVPLSSAAVAILQELPRYKKGNYCFTTTKGKSAIDVTGGKLKDRIDKALAVNRRERAIKKDMPGWTFHDLRRTIRSFFGRSRVAEHVGESVLNHSDGSGRSKISRTYNLYDYFPEKCAALQLWADHLASLTPPSNFIVMKKRKAR